MIDSSTALSEIQWEAVLDKLEQVKRLQERAGTPAEAEAAASALTRLLARYNLTMMELSQRLDRDTLDDYQMQDLRLGGNTRWQRDLLTGIARYNFSRAVFTAGTDKAALVGELRNIEIIKDVYDALVREIDRLANVAREEVKDDAWVGVRSWKRAYRVGVVAGVLFAMRSAHRAAVAEAQTGAALVVLKGEALEKAQEKLVGPTRPMPSPRSIEFGAWDAFERGIKDGQSLDVTHKRPLPA